MAQSRTQSPTVHLLPEVHRTLKLLAVEQGRTLQQVVDEALERYLKTGRDGYGNGSSLNNAELIAHAPTDLALLLAVAEAAREVRDGTGVDYADERLRYAVLQADREDWGRLMTALDALEAITPGA